MKTLKFYKTATLFVAMLFSFAALQASVFSSGKSFDPSVPAGADTSEIALMANGLNVNSYLLSNLEYPQAAIDEGIEGEVRVLCTVGSNGHVSDVKVLSSDDSRLSEAVIKAVYSLSFIPATQNGFTMSYTLVIPVAFDLY
jgi:TonB family protein